VLSLSWIGLVAFFAVFAPVLASGHPLWFSETLADGTRRAWSPLASSLSSADILLLVATLVGVVVFLLPVKKWLGLSIGRRLGLLLASVGQGAVMVVVATALKGYLEQREVPPWAAAWRGRPGLPWEAAAVVGALSVMIFAWLPTFRTLAARVGFTLLVALVAGAAIGASWRTPPEVFNYRDKVEAGRADAVWTLVPWSPVQRGTNLRLLEPGSDPSTPDRDSWIRSQIRPLIAQAREAALPEANAAAEAAKVDAPSPRAAEQRAREEREAVLAQAEAKVRAEKLPEIERQALEKFPRGTAPEFVMGTDGIGQDVLSQMMYACRLSISIGLVSTGIAVAIGVTIGAIMGYFGGWIDTLLFRIVEIFMAIPVLFLLIVAAAVLPRNTYVMMMIIGCVTWTGAARFTRAEFMRLRN
jgi:ABC-type dipeptide/oligopeptide/nickel transport system permease subunit